MQGKSKEPAESLVPHQRGRLLARIGRLGYHHRCKTLFFKGLQIDLVHIADPDRVLDQVAEQEDRRQKLQGVPTPEDQLHLPYWAELWDSGLGIAQHLVAHASRWVGKSALDLGCGMGLAGTVA